MLLIIVRLLKACLEMDSDCQRTLPVPSERIGTECHVCLYVEVIYFMTEEIVFTLGVPFHVLPVLTVGSCI